MPRNPDTPCAGGCGKILWGGRGSLPPGERMCRPCRTAAGGWRQSAMPMLQCPVCGGLFRRNNPRQQTCSVECGVSLRNQRPGGYRGTQTPKPCEQCGVETHRFASFSGTYFCVDCAEARRRARTQRRNLMRRASGEGMSIIELGDRDGWRCHLCGRRVDRRLDWPHPMSGSRDHLVPVVDGGTNDPANLALAHLRCNVSRQHRGPAQLLLFG